MQGRKIFAVLSMVLVVACSPRAIESPATVPSPEIWRIGIQPSLAWLRPQLNSCTQSLPGIQIIVEEESDLDWQSGNAMFLSWGEPARIQGTAYELGMESLVVIVHPSNPVHIIALDGLSGIYEGSANDWGSFNWVGEIHVWTYEQGEVKTLFNQLVPLTGENIQSLYLAPDPSAMREAVASDIQGIGFLPSSWVDDTVKKLDIEGITLQDWQRPVLAIANTPPTAQQYEWLACLDEQVP